MAEDTIEISKRDAATLKKAYDMLQALTNSPDVGTDFKKLVMKHDPKTKFPDIEMAERYSAPINEELKKANDEIVALKKRLDDGEKSSKDKADQDDIMSKIDKVAKKRGLTEEGREGLIKLMREKQVADPEIAVAAYLESLPKAKPTAAVEGTHEGSRLLNGIQEDDNEGEFADFFKNPHKAFDKEVEKILNEPQAA